MIVVRSLGRWGWGGGGGGGEGDLAAVEQDTGVVAGSVGRGHETAVTNRRSELGCELVRL
jgi:hypothetical protein